MLPQLHPAKRLGDHKAHSPSLLQMIGPFFLRIIKLAMPLRLFTSFDTTALGRWFIKAKFLGVDCGYENHADVVGAINILERGYRLLARGESAQSDRSLKQEPTEVTQATFV